MAIHGGNEIYSTVNQIEYVLAYVRPAGGDFASASFSFMVSSKLALMAGMIMASVKQ